MSDMACIINSPGLGSFRIATITERFGFRIQGAFVDIAAMQSLHPKTKDSQ